MSSDIMPPDIMRPEIIVPFVMYCALLLWVGRGLNWTQRLATAAVTLVSLAGLGLSNGPDGCPLRCVAAAGGTLLDFGPVADLLRALRS